LLVGASKAKFIQAVQEFRPEGKRPEIFGDGKASQKIAHHLESMNRS